MPFAPNWQRSGQILIEDPTDKNYQLVRRKANLATGLPTFATYEDHRMAMAFAPLALLGGIEVEEPLVVGKSYPDFWKDLESIGFQVRAKD